jgi:3-hydroxy-9,10-secoandrosta-1,3,5(10)-triene-9,17-dione monooxygenase reductase component
MADPLTAPLAVQPTPAEWRAAMGGFASGVTVVTSWRDGAPIGSTVSAFSSVSLEPPLLLICLGLQNPLCEPIADCGIFGVNILGDDGQELARRFAFALEEERFAGVDHRTAERGAPQIDQASVFIDCAVQSRQLAGDHLVVIGRGLRTDQRGARSPLLHYKGRFAGLAPGG